MLLLEKSKRTNKMFIEKYKGFEIHLEILDEYISPDDMHDWESSDDREEFYSKLESGELLWFCAKVSAYMVEIELATEYLGGCCYSSIDNFINDEYYSSMRDEVINNAIDEIVTTPPSLINFEALSYWVDKNAIVNKRIGGDHIFGPTMRWTPFLRLFSELS